ncbi:exopolysaccharide biosynthesis protein [Roseivivax sediminis]|uniref:Uncharacterized conserved protein n=1 Tax=Roseivivax sediminis TaxID=936889 RepID=A0A1I1UGY5_9RHOB|nr:exopolysaccharide biosynthesis protein [Roseivivax sediminis]SFD70122.1 Uncharacterized conserved protein [Roseivivax sediminis]
MSSASPSAAPEAAPVTTLGELLARIRPDPDEDTVSVGDILRKVGDRSFTAVILVPALILVSPVSGIPGTPTIGALIILLAVGQALTRRDHLWLPGFVTRRRIGAARLRQGLDFLRRPVAWIDRHSRNRWRVLTFGPMRTLAQVMIAFTALTWPALELLPFFTSFGAAAVSLFAIGLLIRDGLYIVGGYVMVGAAFGVAFAIWQGLV